MKLTILRSNLLSALSRTAPIAKQKSTMPALSCVLIRADLLQPITVQATNLAQSVTARAPADVAEAGAICVSARDIEARVKTFPEGPISVVLTDKHLQLSAGKRKHRIPVIPAEDFPPLAPPPEGGAVVPGQALATVLEQAAPAASDDVERVAIHCVFLEFLPGELRATATDGRRVHRSTAPVAGLVARDGVRLPVPSVEAILAMLDKSKDATVGGSTEFGVRSGDATLTTKLATGQFPPVDDFLRNPPQDAFSVDPALLGDALSSVALGSGDGPLQGILTLTVESGELRVAGKESEDSLPLSTPPAHPPAPTSVSSAFLLAALRHADPAATTLELSPQELSPIYVRSPRFVAIVMPCRA